MPLLSSTTLAMNTHVAPRDRHKPLPLPPRVDAPGSDARALAPVWGRVLRRWLRLCCPWGCVLPGAWRRTGTAACESGRASPGRR
ncbi:hypothetical protein E2C01_073565 [Portunus trituberculatus]|uniref:Uncharacterized protein n=1 Tax=Portunus trituberculatus TaxID=210409 RepID=A0A5B7I9S0_PORTR|nr:hypothetical protein [Portunus trituberculatus]